MDATGPKKTEEVDLSANNYFPNDVKKLILSFLTNHDPFQAIEDLRNLSHVDRAWRNVVLEWLRNLWIANEQKWASKFHYDFQKLRKVQNLEHVIDLSKWQVKDDPGLDKQLRDRMLQARIQIAELSKTEEDRKRLSTYLVIRQKIRFLVIAFKSQGLPVPQSMIKALK